MSKPRQAPMPVLLRAARRALELYDQEVKHDAKRLWGGSVLKGAPSHTGAYLLQALEEEGWELRRTASGSPTR